MGTEYQVIDKLEMLLKNEAGVESFTSTNNGDPDPNLDPSGDVDVPRCESCNGELLRGSQSIICVYCGRGHSLPDPISFDSTLAFQWFLHSLGFSPNETQGSMKEDQFLDLHLNPGGFGLKDEQPLTGKTYLSLIGVDIHDILSASSVANEQVVVNPEIDNQEFRLLGERNLSLFENVPPSEAAIQSAEHGNDDSFADWGAEFQTANISSFSGPSGSNLKVSSNHLSSTMNSSGQPFEFKESDDNISVESNLNLPAQQHIEKKHSINNEKKHDDDSFDEWGDFRMSRADTIIQDEPISTAGPTTDTSDGLGITDSYNDLSKDNQSQKGNFTVSDDAWNDLIIPGSGGDISSQYNNDKPELHVGTGDLLDVAFLEHHDVHSQSAQNKISVQSDSFGLWENEVHLNSLVDQIPCKESMSPADEGITKLDNSFDLWNNFRGSVNQQETNTEAEVADTKLSTEGGNTFDAWNGFSGLSMEKKEEQADRLEIVGVNINGNQSESSGLWNDNSLDEWNDFTGSTVVSNSKQIANEDSLGAWNDLSSLMVAHENTRNNSTRAYEDHTALADGNLFSSWSDFGSLGLQTGDSSAGPNITNTSSDQVSFHVSSNSLENVGNNNTLDSWGDFGGATSILEQQLQAAGAATSKTNLSSGDGDFFSGVGNNGKQSSSQPDCQLNMNEGKFMEENFDSFAWGDFTTSSNAEANFSRSTNAPTPNNKEAVHHGHLLAAWNDVVSSPNEEAGKDTGSRIGKNPDSNLFSPNLNSQYVGAISNQNGSAPVASTNSGISDFIRVEHLHEGKKMSESSQNEGLDAKVSIAESLISEMHDLSFMLENSLSIPNTGV